MRLDRLHIRSRFKNLCDFRIDFDEDSEMTVLVGHNGTGKSNLLEALTIIFRRDNDSGQIKAQQPESEPKYPGVPACCSAKYMACVRFSRQSP